MKYDLRHISYFLQEILHIIGERSGRDMYATNDMPSYTIIITNINDNIVGRCIRAALDKGCQFLQTDVNTLGKMLLQAGSWQRPTSPVM